MTIQIAGRSGKYLLTGLGVSLILGAGSVAGAVEWDGNGGVGGDWFTDVNWDTDAVPTASDAVEIRDASASSEANPVVIAGGSAVADSLRFGYSFESNGGYLDIQDDLTVTGKFSSYRGFMDVDHAAGTVSASELYIGERATPLSRYRISGNASLNVSGNTTLGRGDNGSVVEFLQEGGAVTLVGQFRVGSSTAGTTGTFLYDMSAGTLDAGQVIVGWKSAGNHFRQSGGTATVSQFMVANDSNDPGTGKLTLQDAAQFTSNGNVQIGGGPAGGTASAVLDGSRTGAGTDLIVADNGNFTLKDQSTLQAILDADAIADPLNMRKIDVTGNVTFENGALLDVLFDDGVTPTAGMWTLVTSDGSFNDNGLTFAPGVDTNLWSFDTDETGQQLTISYVPEPASLALLSAGGLLMLARRRR